MEIGTISYWEELTSHTAKDVEAEMVGRIQLSLQLIIPELDLFHRPTLFTAAQCGIISLTTWSYFSSVGKQAW